MGLLKKAYERYLADYWQDMQNGQDLYSPAPSIMEYLKSYSIIRILKDMFSKD